MIQFSVLLLSLNTSSDNQDQTDSTPIRSFKLTHHWRFNQSQTRAWETEPWSPDPVCTQRSKVKHEENIDTLQTDRSTDRFVWDSSDWFDLIDWLIWSAVTWEVGQTSDRLSDVFKSRRKTGNSCHKNNLVFQQHSPQPTNQSTAWC